MTEKVIIWPTDSCASARSAPAATSRAAVERAARASSKARTARQISKHAALASSATAATCTTVPHALKADSPSVVAVSPITITPLDQHWSSGVLTFQGYCILYL